MLFTESSYIPYLLLVYCMGRMPSIQLSEIYDYLMNFLFTLDKNLFAGG